MVGTTRGVTSARGPVPVPLPIVDRPPRAVRERWLMWRDRLLASPGFQRIALRLPLIRGVARQRAGAVFDLVAGFVYSQVLVACVRLDVFGVLANGPLPLDVIAARIGLDRDAAARLLDAAVALRLADRRAGGYGLGVRGAPLVRNAAVAAMVEHHALLYADLADPVALLRLRSTRSPRRLIGLMRPTAAGRHGGRCVGSRSARRGGGVLRG